MATNGIRTHARTNQRHNPTYLLSPLVLILTYMINKKLNKFENGLR